MSQTVIRLPQVQERTGLSRSTIYSLIRDGEFPKQIRLHGRKSVGWVEAEVDKWIEERIAQSRALDP